MALSEKAFAFRLIKILSAHQTPVTLQIDIYLSDFKHLHYYYYMQYYMHHYYNGA